MSESKVCTKCNEVKHLTLFHKHKKTKDKRHNVCKSCHLKRTNEWRKNNKERNKELQRNRTYSLEEGWYEETLKEQKFKCFACNTHQKDLKYSLCVDHCHTSGKPRGLLCKPCNLALGNCNDDPEILRRLAEYIETRGV